MRFAPETRADQEPRRALPCDLDRLLVAHLVGAQPRHSSAMAYWRGPRQAQARALTSFGRVPLGCAGGPPASARPLMRGHGVNLQTGTPTNTRSIYRRDAPVNRADPATGCFRLLESARVSLHSLHRSLGWPIRPAASWAIPLESWRPRFVRQLNGLGRFRTLSVDILSEAGSSASLAVSRGLSCSDYLSIVLQFEIPMNPEPCSPGYQASLASLA